MTHSSEYNSDREYYEHCPNDFNDDMDYDLTSSLEETDEEPDLICGHCNGSGEGQHEFTRCPICRGSGVYKFLN